MKKLLLTILAILGLFSLEKLSAQKTKGIYVGLNAGYGFAANTYTNVLGLQNSTQISTNVYENENVKTSLGKGIHFGGAVGYMFNKNFGTELNINYLLGGKTTSTDTSLSGNVTKNSAQANVFQLKPSIIVTTGMPSINPYARFGFVVSKAKIESNSDSASPNGDYLRINRDYTGGFQFGIQGAFGINFAINPKIVAFSELEMVGATYAPDRSEITKYETSSGGLVTDLLPTLTTNQKETEYSDSYTVDFGNPADPNLPRKQTKFKLPLSSFGINVGVKYLF
jgi:Outer membrane protein beta-barrel domain